MDANHAVNQALTFQNSNEESDMAFMRAQNEQDARIREAAKKNADEAAKAEEDVKIKEN